MTDNRTTELLRKLLDERGVKYSDFTSATKNGKAIFKTRWKHECGYAELSEWESTGSNNLFIQNVDPEQAVAATLGRPKVKKVRGLMYDEHGGEVYFLACSGCGDWVDGDLDCIGEADGPNFCHNCGGEFDGPLLCKRCGELADMEFGDMCAECYWHEGEGNDER